MARPCEQLGGRPRLDDAPAVHDKQPVTDARHHRQVVADEQERRAVLVHEVAEQGNDLRLYRHVERRGRLVGEQERRPARDGHRQHHPLALPARQLIGKGPGLLPRLVEADPREQLGRPGP
jgi:hypothetical protein